MKKNYNAYKGKLSVSQIVHGMNIAEENAHRLVEDASILLNSGRYPTAFSLALLALEELGKVILLRYLVIIKKNSERVEIWKAYRSHTTKNAMWMMQLFAIVRRITDNSKPNFLDAFEYSLTFDQAKQLGFYSDYLGKSRWWNPLENCDDKFAKKIVCFAKLLIKNIKHTEKEIELFNKHIGPLWESKDNSNKQAIENWENEMNEAGLSVREVIGLGKYPDQKE